jgi:hypothetical protein
MKTPTRNHAMHRILTVFTCGFFASIGAQAIQIGPDPRAPIPTGPTIGQQREGPRVTFNWNLGPTTAAPQNFTVCVGRAATATLDCKTSLRFVVSSGGARSYTLPTDLPAAWQGQTVAWSVSACYPAKPPAPAMPDPVPSCYTSSTASFVLLPWPPRPRPPTQAGDRFQPYFEFKYVFVHATLAQLQNVHDYAGLRQLAGAQQPCVFVGEVNTPRLNLDVRPWGQTPPAGQLPKSFSLAFDFKGTVPGGCTSGGVDYAAAANWAYFVVRDVPLESAAGISATPALDTPDNWLARDIAIYRGTIQFPRPNRPAIDFRPAYGLSFKYLDVNPQPVVDGSEVSGSFGFIARQEDTDFAIVVFDGSFRLKKGE